MLHTPHTWVTGEVISAGPLNALENDLAAAASLVSSLEDDVAGVASGLTGLGTTLSAVQSELAGVEAELASVASPSDPTVSQMPAGITLTVLKSGSTWPARPTARADVVVAWKGPDPSPSIVSSGTAGMLNNVDYRLVTA